MQPRNEPKQIKQVGRESTIYLMLFFFAAMIISALSIDCKADENDWFVYLGTQEAKKAHRKNINAAEALPLLPLPATSHQRYNVLTLLCVINLSFSVESSR